MTLTTDTESPNRPEGFVPKHPLAECWRCPWFRGSGYAAAKGPENSNTLFVGIAPGRDEIRTGIPFTGPSGKLLDKVLDHNGFDKSNIRFTNVVACHPKGKKSEDPPKEAIEACAPRLQAELKDKKTIVLLGKIAFNSVLHNREAITKARQGPPRYSDLYPGAKIVPTFHPAACLRASDYFPSLARDVRKAKIDEASLGWEPPIFKVFDDEQSAVAVLEELIARNLPYVSVDIECPSEKDEGFTHPNSLLCVGIGFEPNKAVVIGEEPMKSRIVWERLKRLFRKTKVLAHNGKFDIQVMMRLGIIDNPYMLAYDTMLASYTTDERPGYHSLEGLACEHLGSPSWKSEIAPYVGKGKKKNYANIPRPILYKYNAYDVAQTYNLWHNKFERELDSQGLRRLHDFLIDASNELLYVELEGTRIDENYLAWLIDEYSHELSILEDGLNPWVDNPRSTPQVLVACHELGINVKSTGAAILRERLEHPMTKDEQKEFLEKILNYRKENKLFGTYVKGTLNRLNNGRLYTTFKLHGTVTGRLSSANPNCYSEDTEILTPRGWVLFKELSQDDKVAQWDDGVISFVTPNALIERDYAGEMVHITADYMDLLVTPDHRMISTARRQDTVFVESASMWEQKLHGQIWDRKIIRGGIKIGGKSLTDEEFLILQQAVCIQAEGHLRADIPQFEISVHSRRKKQQLAELFGDRVRYRKNNHAVWIQLNDPALEWLNWTTTSDKVFKTEKILELSSEDLNDFLAEVMRWDGDYTRNNTFGQNHIRESAVDTVQAAALLSGHSTSWYNHITADLAVVNVHHKTERTASRIWANNVPYNGKIYCVSVPSSAVVVRRNKQPLVCGNCQNIPRGPKIKRLFVPNDGNVLIQTDYKQAEWRAIACLAHDRYLQAALSDPNQDIHGYVANLFFGSNYTKEQRVMAKTFVFGVAYGRGAEAVGAAFGVSTARAQKYIDDFFEVIPDVVRWRASVHEKLFKGGQALQTPFGRKRRFWLVTHENKHDIEKEALAFLPQSIASDLTLNSLIKLRRKFADTEARIRLTIHDSIIAECPKEVELDVANEMKETMESTAAEVFSDYVPFLADVESGVSWGDLSEPDFAEAP